MLCFLFFCLLIFVEPCILILIPLYFVGSGVINLSKNDKTTLKNDKQGGKMKKKMKEMNT